MNIVLAIIILLGYTISLCIKGGCIPNSLSASVFNLQIDKRWIWTVVLYSVCFLVLYPVDILPYSVSILDKASENTRFLIFIAVAALAFVGAAPLVKDKTDLAYKVHCVSAVVSAVTSQIFLGFNNWIILLLWIPFVFAFSIYYNKGANFRTKVFWAEQVCFSSIFIYCLI